jgi:hypothetical protein
MKKLLAILLVAGITSGCHHQYETETPDTGNVTFGIAAPSTTGGRIASTSLPAFVLFTVHTTTTSNTWENIRLALYAFGQQYLSDHFELPPGSYTLTSFAVLNSDDRVIYAAPIDGSPLASYVTSPLPISFSITGGAETQVVPEVLAVSDDVDPTSFGYATIGFRPVSVTALQLPTVTETVVRVHAEFRNSSDTVIVDTPSPGLILDLRQTALAGQTWNVRLYMFTEMLSEQGPPCYPKVYRYKGDITFDGALHVLPDIYDQHWYAFLYHEAGGAKIFFPADPRGSFQVEIQTSVPVYGYVDRDYYNEAGDAICNSSYIELNGKGTIEAVMNVNTGCETSDLRGMDSFLFINSLIDGRPVFLYSFWNIDANGHAGIDCFNASSNGRKISRAPAFPHD